MSRRPPLPRDGVEARSYNKLRHLQSVRLAADQKKLARVERGPRFGLLRRIVRLLRGGGD